MCRYHRRQLLIPAELHRQASERNWSCTNQRKGLWPHPFVKQMHHGGRGTGLKEKKHRKLLWHMTFMRDFNIGLIIDHLARLSNTIWHLWISFGKNAERNVACASTATQPSPQAHTRTASWPDRASWVVQPNYEGRNIRPLAERIGRDLPVSKPDPAAMMIHDDTSLLFFWLTE